MGKIALCSLLASVGCAVRRGPSRDVLDAAVTRGFIDLQPGWRVKVFAPVLKSAGYIPQMTEEKQPDNSVRLSAADLVGYETSYYSVRARKGEMDRAPRNDEVKVEVASVSLTKDGKTTKQRAPNLQLFDLPDTVRFVRLLYLVRVSGADHVMAIIAAATPVALDELTRKIETDPAENCAIGAVTYCKWVPKGIGVQIASSTH